MRLRPGLSDNQKLTKGTLFGGKNGGVRRFSTSDGEESELFSTMKGTETPKTGGNL